MLIVHPRRAAERQRHEPDLLPISRDLRQPGGNRRLHLPRTRRGASKMPTDPMCMCVTASSTCRNDALSGLIISISRALLGRSAGRLVGTCAGNRPNPALSSGRPRLTHRQPRVLCVLRRLRSRPRKFRLRSLAGFRVFDPQRLRLAARVHEPSRFSLGGAGLARSIDAVTLASFTGSCVAMFYVLCSLSLGERCRAQRSARVCVACAQHSARLWRAVSFAERLPTSWVRPHDLPRRPTRIASAVDERVSRSSRFAVLASATPCQGLIARAALNGIAGSGLCTDGISSPSERKPETVGGQRPEHAAVDGPRCNDHGCCPASPPASELGVLAGDGAPLVLLHGLLDCAVGSEAPGRGDGPSLLRGRPARLRRFRPPNTQPHLRLHGGRAGRLGGARRSRLHAGRTFARWRCRRRAGRTTAR